jgi:molecular chaperone DnaJ
MAADFYELFGVQRTASNDEIKKAYRRRARELHPDANPNDPKAEEQFKELARAYEVLSDDDKRARYDRFGEQGVGGAGGGGGADFGAGGLGDIFEAFFGNASPFGGGGGGRGGRPAGPPRGQDLEVVADLTFEQAVFGAKVPVTVRTASRCTTCEGSGAGQGTKPVTCSECNGAGQVRRMRQSLLGQMVTTAACPRCSGLGQIIATPCSTCRGDGRTVGEETYTVEVPAGIDHGATLRLTGRGAVGPRGGDAGDLYVHLRVGAHARFDRAGNDLIARFPISFAQASLGATLPLAMLDGAIEQIDIPAGTQPNKEFVLRGKGVPNVQGRGRGDLRVVVQVEIPTKLSSPESELLRRYAEERGEPVSPPDKGLLSRLKSKIT